MYNITNQSELKVNTWTQSQARENAGIQITLGFTSASDWSREWREFSASGKEQSEAKSMQSLDIQLKIA